jgi:hypothetical protein
MKSSSANNVQNAMIPVSCVILLPQIANSVEISQALSTSYMITNVWWNALMGTGETSQPINVKHASLSVQHASAIQPNNAIHVPTVMVSTTIFSWVPPTALMNARMGSMK